MVVLLIMANLMAIAIPTLLGVGVGAEDRATQSVLSNALISAKAGYWAGGAAGRLVEDRHRLGRRRQRGDTTAAGDASNAIPNTPTVAGDEYNDWTSGSGSTCTNAVPSSGTSGWLFHY
jgi:type II secretory pathway pseudopilin PulG